MRIVNIVIFTALSGALMGCAELPFGKPGASVSAKPPEGTMRPRARPDSMTTRRPPENARTVEQFDTTTAAERQKAAAAPTVAAETTLGETVASLGDPARPGFWLETPLVETEQPGRILNPATGKSAQVTLIPIDGPDTAGSRISLAAMRLIEAPLTDLPRLQVFSGG